MKILSLHQPINGGTLYSGDAVSARGQYYKFCATLEGHACCVFKEDTSSTLPDGRTYWHQINRASAPLRHAVAEAVRRSRH